MVSAVITGVHSIHKSEERGGVTVIDPVVPTGIGICMESSRAADHFAVLGYMINEAGLGARCIGINAAGKTENDRQRNKANLVIRG